MSRTVWAIALPAMLTNVATALFGLADMWVIGRLGDAAAQGAVELGAKFMMGLLIVFNFLRTSTIALTAQSAGRGEAAEQAATLARAVGAALLIGAVLLLCRPFAITGGLALLEAKGEVAANARIYIDIRYWAGAAWLINAVLIGWLIGRRRVRIVLAAEVGSNIVHIALDLALVLALHWGIAGVAVATVSSELLKLAFLIAVVARDPAIRHAPPFIRASETWDGLALRRLFSLNRDLFLRTVLLTGAILAFTRAGAQQGPLTLAANGILFQIFMLSTLILDGFESAAQVLCGEAKGARDRAKFVGVIRSALLWAGVTGAAITLAYLAGGSAFARSFSVDPRVGDMAAAYVGWVVLLPLLCVPSFVLDGVFIGAAWTRALLGTMVAALIVYCGLLLLVPLGNHPLWLAFSLLFLARGLAQLAVLPKLVRRDFPPG